MKFKKIVLRKGIIMLFLLIVAGNYLSAQENNYKIEVKQMDGIKALVIKADIPTAEIADNMGPLFGKLMNYMQEKEVAPGGPPFAVYYSFDPEGNTVFEIGAPVASACEGNGEIEFKEYPPTKAVSTLFVGAYADMVPVYEAMDKYMKDNNLEHQGIVWEVYYTDPSEVAPEENQTLIYYPLKD